MNYRTFSTPAFLGCALCFLSSYNYPKSTEKNPERLKEKGPYDVIIVPGVPYQDPTLKVILKARILWAKYLFDNGIAKNIIFSGSAVYNPYIEGVMMRIYADSLGIPSSHTFSETQAEHSTENIFYSLLMAKKLRFKKIAVATDQYQAIIIRNFMKKKCPEIEVILIEYNKIKLVTSAWPEIDPSSACADNFVSLVEREDRVKRFKGTLGKNISFIENDSSDCLEKKAAFSFAELGKFSNAWVSSANLFLSGFNNLDPVR